MRKKTQKPLTAETLISEIERLVGHAESLDRSVQKLAARIVMYEGENLLDYRLEQEPNRDKKKPITMSQIYELMERAKVSIVRSEYDLASIRSYVDTLAKDAYPAADLKQWIKPKHERD